MMKKILIGASLLITIFVFVDAEKLYFNPFKNPYIEYTVEDTSGPANKNKISVIASNLWMLRVKLAGITPMEEPFIEERAKHFANALKGPDVIVVEEAFTPEARGTILRGLRAFGYKYATQILGAGKEVDKYNITNSKLNSDLFAKTFPLPVINLNDDEAMKNKTYSQAGNGNKPWAARGNIGDTKVPLPSVMDGGVMIISKYPIEKALQLFYQRCSGWDCGAKKGVVYAKINKDGQIYHIFGTHADTGDDEQEHGYNRLGKEIENIVGNGIQEPVLVAGDFNFGGEADDKRAQYLNVTMPKLKIYPDLYCAEDPEQGSFSADGERRQVGNCGYERQGGQCTVDHVFFSHKHLAPKTSYNQPRPMYSKTPWGVRTGRPESGYKYELYNEKTMKKVERNISKNVYGAVPVSDLSDHFAIYGYFEF